MQLQRGTCIFCINTKIVKPPYDQEVYKIITTLLSKGLINSAEFDRVQLQLKFCPICYHKLLIAERTRANINSNEISYEASNGGCLLCKSKKNLFEVNEWSGLKEKLEGFTISRNNTLVTCSDCLYYLEIKNEIKTKLFSKYPQLRVKPESSNVNERRVKPKFIPKIKLKSVPVFVTDRGKASRKRKFSKVNESPPVDDSLTETNINFHSVKKFKPLKEYNIFRNHKLIKTDVKFLNQVPYVLLNTTQLGDNSNLDKTVELNAPTIYEDTDYLTIDCKNLNKKNGKLNSRPLKLENDLEKLGIEKHLVVNVSRIQTENYIQKADSNLNIKDLNDELKSLQNLHQTMEDSDVNSSCIMDDSLEEPENKNKRKSVSFAEDKNVEIEYFENESNTKYINSNNDSFESFAKRYNKGILKRDSNVDEITDNSEDPIKVSVQDVSQTGDSQSTRRDNKNKNELNDELDEINDSDSNASNDLSKLYESDKASLETEEKVSNDIDETDEVRDNENIHNINEENRRSKPKPFSKRKRRKTVTEDSDEESNAVDKQFSSNEDQLEKNYSDVNNSEQITNKLEEGSASISGNISDSNISDEDETEKHPEDKKKEEDTSESNSRKNKTDSDPNEEREKKQDENSNNSTNEESGSENENEKSFSKTSGNLETEVNAEDDFSCNEDEKINDCEELCHSTDISSQEENVQSVEKNANTSDDENERDRILRVEENLENIFCTGSKIKSTTKNENDSENKESIDNQYILSSSEPSEGLDRNDIYSSNNGSENINSSSKSHNNMDIDNDNGNATNVENQQKSINTADRNDEEITKRTNISTDDRIYITADEFDEFEKSADLNISEVDSENIKSLLSNMFSSEIPEESILEDTTSCVKKKTGEDELSNINKDKKKKKVTFCDDDM